MPFEVQGVRAFWFALTTIFLSCFGSKKLAFFVGAWQRRLFFPIRSFFAALDGRFGKNRRVGIAAGRTETAEANET